MKKQVCFALILAITISLLTGFSHVTAQQVSEKTIPLKLSRIVNFKTLADYRKAHPLKHPKRYIEQGEDREHGSTFKPHNATPGSPVFNFNTASERTTQKSPSPRIVFNGIISNGTDFPPDINGAVNGTYILETTNQEFDIFTKNGALNSVIDIPTFFSSIGYYYFDPHVEYDAFHKRFIIISDGFYSSNNDGALFVAVSETDDPTGNWYQYNFDATVVSTTDFIDYPLVGYNKNFVVLTANDYTSGGEQSNYYVLDRASLYSGSLGTLKVFSDGNYVEVTPTQTYDTTTTVDYLVQDANGDQGGVGYIQVGYIGGTVSNPTYVAGHTIGVSSPWSDNGIGATQLGTDTTIESGLDTKIENAIYRNGSLWCTQAVYLPADNPTHSAINWFQVNPTALTITQFGRIEDPAGNIFYYYPSIAVDTANDVLIGYCTSSSSTYASSMYSYHGSKDAANSMETGYLFQPGQDRYVLVGGGRNRYGDFTYTTSDPADGSFWTFQEFAAAPEGTWGTVVANVGNMPCSGKPTVGTISTAVDTVCLGNGTVLNLNNFNPQGTNGISVLWQQSLNGTTGWTTASGGSGDSTAIYATPSLNRATYFRCVETCFNSGLTDTTAAFLVNLPTVYTISQDTFCQPGNYNIIGTSKGSELKWFNTGNTNTPFYVGDTLNITLSKDTSFYTQTSFTKHYTVGIADDNYGVGSYYNYTYAAGLYFSAITNFTLDSLYVYANSTGDVTVNLYDSASGAIVHSLTVAISNAQVNQKTVVHTNFACVGGINYNINATSSTVNSLFRTSSDADYPYTVPGIVSITGANNAATGHYYFFYDWHITTQCTSGLTPVNVVIGQMPFRITATPDTLCKGSGDSTLLVVHSGATGYDWTGVNSTDSVVYVKPAQTTTYSVSGSNGSGCTGQGSIVVDVKTCEGVNDVESNNPSIDIYPNPNTGQFDVIMNNLALQNYTVSLYNILGQNLIEKATEINSSHYTMPLDASTLPAGFYIVKVLSGNRQWTKQVSIISR